MQSYLAHSRKSISIICGPALYMIYNISFLELANHDFFSTLCLKNVFALCQTDITYNIYIFLTNIMFGCLISCLRLSVEKTCVYDILIIIYYYSTHLLILILIFFLYKLASSHPIITLKIKVFVPRIDFYSKSFSKKSKWNSPFLFYHFTWFLHLCLDLTTILLHTILP